MTKEIEAILEGLEEEGNSASLAVADHIRIVASNGREYRTPEAIQEEASALIEASMRLHKPLQDALRDAKAALVGESNDDERSALVAIVEALGEGRPPECSCDWKWRAGKHSLDCPAKAWEEARQNQES